MKRARPTRDAAPSSCHTPGRSPPRSRCVASPGAKSSGDPGCFWLQASHARVWGIRGEMVRVCIDLTPNEMIDRFGGIGRYGYLLLEALQSLPESERLGVELCALERSTGPILGAGQALSKRVLERKPIPLRQHRWQRRLLSGRLLATARVDVFHAVQPLALPLFSNVPTVVTCHDIIPLAFPRPNPPLKSAWIKSRETVTWTARLRRASRILAISRQTADDLNELLRIPSSRISVVHHGVDLDLFRPDVDTANARKKFDLPPRWFVSVGSDHYRKNHTTLFDAWCEVSKDIPEGLVVVGKALYESTLQSIHERVAQLGLQGRFRWLDDVEDPDLPALYSGATAAVAPSLYEGFGMTLLEAMACGAPVAAARNGAYEEVGGEAALYFDGRSVKSLAGALRELSRDSHFRERLRRQGLEHVRDKTWANTARATLEVYRDVARADK